MVTITSVCADQNSPLLVSATATTFWLSANLMRVAIREAGLPARCVPHGLRKAVLRTMAEMGSSSKRLAAVSGHKTTKELDRYTAAADQATLADDGIDSIPIRK